MPKIYADLIRKGVKTIEDVPVHLRSAVKALLKDAGHEQASGAAAENLVQNGGGEHLEGA